MPEMTVHRSENGILFSSRDESALQYSALMHPTTNHLLSATAGNHGSYLVDEHQHHLNRHLAANEAPHATITINPLTMASDQTIPLATDDTCHQRKKTFYVLIALIVLGIFVMVITVITAVVIFFKCE